MLLHFVNELLPFWHHAAPVTLHCLKFNPVVHAYDKAHHFLTCVG